MQVSVVIPVHNRKQLVPRAVESVLSQTRPPEEIIVVDDGSTDGTAAAVVDRFAGVRCLRQERRSGVSAARNRGVVAATGDWIAFLDSDDEWLPEKLERQLAALTESPGHRICHTDEIWIRRGRRVNQGLRHAKAGGRIFRQCLPLCVISPSSVVLERRLLDDLGGFDETLPACEDYDLWLRICASRPVLFVAEPLVIKHGGHDDQLSRTVPALDRYRIRALEKLLESVDLAPGDRAAVIEILATKIDIFVAGARRRGHDDTAAEYLARKRRWCGPDRLAPSHAPDGEGASE